MFYVGQKVWCAMFGEGVVARISHKSVRFPVVVNFGEPLERCYSFDGKYMQLYDTQQTLFPYPVEIVKKLVKPSINWEHVRGEYKFLAQDSTGVAWLYSEEPTLGEDFWDVSMGLFALADTHTSYTPGTSDWKDSLVARPKDA